MRGEHCVRHWSQTQPTIALSSGEAELTGMAKGIAKGIGLRSIAQDLGITLQLKLRTDATAAMGISRRLGIGKIRHLNTSLLWVQQKVRCGEVVLGKELGSQKPADALTKYRYGPDLRHHRSRVGVAAEEGRATTAPQLTREVLSALSAEK